ncbi:hypothetical protein V8E54_000949 [Elaphomyces granulatus]
MYYLPSNWTAQRSAEQESEMGYLARIRKGEAKGAMDSTITTIEKTQEQTTNRRCTTRPRHHSDPRGSSPGRRRKSSLCSQCAIRPPASVREDNHDIRLCTPEPPLLLSEEILMLRFILLGHGLETWSWTLEDVGHKAGNPSPSPSPFKCPGSPGEERGDRPMDRDPFCEG